MASYRIEITRSAAKEIEDLPERERRRVVARIAKLREEPRPAGAIRLKGSEAYRLRQGDYRILYLIDDDRIVITIVRVDHRRNVYR